MAEKKEGKQERKKDNKEWKPIQDPKPGVYTGNHPTNKIND